MSKLMLMDAKHPEETRVVVVDNDTIEDFDFVTSSKAQVKGNIYLAKITRVEPSLQAAFVEYGGNKQGFLPFSEIHPDYYQIPVEDRQRLIEEEVQEAEREEAEEEAELENKETKRGARGGKSRGRRRGRRRPTREEEAEASPEDAEDGDVKALQADQPEIASEPIEEADDESSDAEGDTEESEVETVSADDAEESRPRRRGSSFKRYRIQEVIKRNQIVLVQVIKEERGNKGCSLTSYLSLAGRYCVLMPNSPKGGGVSRKISNGEQRRKLKEMLAELRDKRGFSAIIRTAGLDRTKAEIKRDYEYLVKLWTQIREDTLASTAPSLIYEESDIIKRSLRDIYTGDIENVWVQGADAYRDCKAFMKMIMPSHAPRVKEYKDESPLFAVHGVEQQLASMYEPTVKMPSGGYLVIQQTEALTSVDVNSGRSTTERNVEETAIKTNLEAAREMARQMRLRDVAGLIVIDFIDMYYGKNRRTLEKAMKDCLKGDRAKIQVSRISPFGLMELSRQRLRPSIAESSTLPCDHCQGTGFVKSKETVVIQILRLLEREAAMQDYNQLRIHCTADVAMELLNERRSFIQEIEEQQDLSIVIRIDAEVLPGQFRLFKIGDDGKEQLHIESEDDRGRKRKSRGRRGGRGRRSRHEQDNASDNASDYNAESEKTEDSAEEPQPEKKDFSEETKKESKPRRSRGRRKRADSKPKQEQEQQPKTEQSADVKPAEQKAEQPVDAKPLDDKAKDKPKRTRRRAATKSAATAKQEESSSEEKKAVKEEQSNEAEAKADVSANASDGSKRRGWWNRRSESEDGANHG